MFRSRTISAATFCRAVVATLLTATVLSSAARAVEPAERTATGDPAAGRILFERTWTAAQGLGPFFNERSCVACHSLGGMGGAGPNSKNVELLSVEVPAWIQAAKASPQPLSFAERNELNSAVAQLERSAADLDSRLADGGTVLHTFCSDERYQAYREALLRLGSPAHSKHSLKQAPQQQAGGPATASVEPRHLEGPAPIKRIVHRNVTLLLSARNSTAMYGAGLIDKISDGEIRLVAAEEAVRYPTMAGRFLGRFGWRAQTTSLAQFVAGACTVELGLDVPRFDDTRASPASPVAANDADAEIPTPSVSTVGSDLSLQEFNNLVSFVASIPAPTRLKPADVAQASQIEKGEQIFAAIGCAVCHRPSIGHAVGIFSDLLVHDMGVELADSQPAPIRTFQRALQYYNMKLGFEDEMVDPRRLREWRTPPLWGLADSAPYLHDGRAPTIERAILAHGGQAAESTAAFVALDGGRKRFLLEFLSTLVAPETPERLHILPAAKPPHTATPPRAATPARSPKSEPVAVDPHALARRAAEGRLRLAMAAEQRGDHASARRWLTALVEEFPDTAAAADARRTLDSPISPGAPGGAALEPSASQRSQTIPRGDEPDGRAASR
jgi:CxxC motif-containing protein (DUF1111 family)